MQKKIKEWIKVEKEMKILKEKEMNLRKEICEYILKDKIKGSKKATIGNYTLSATAKLNYNIDEAGLKSIWTDLSKKERAVIKFKPKIVAKYLADIGKSRIHEMITAKPGTPGLILKG